MWSTHTPASSSDTTPCVYPYSARLNSMLAVYHDSVTELSCDMLVLPFDVPSDHITTGIYLVPITHAYVHSLSLPLSLSLSPELNRVLQVGGPDLMIEMSLLEDCLLGENLLTSGHLLPAQSKHQQWTLHIPCCIHSLHFLSFSKTATSSLVEFEAATVLSCSGDDCADRREILQLAWTVPCYWHAHGFSSLWSAAVASSLPGVVPAGAPPPVSLPPKLLRASRLTSSDAVGGAGSVVVSVTDC